MESIALREHQPIDLESRSSEHSYDVYGIFASTYSNFTFSDPKVRSERIASGDNGEKLRRLLREQKILTDKDNANNEPGLFICLIDVTATDPSFRFLQDLQIWFPSFPRPLVEYIQSSCAFRKGATLIPESRSTAGLSFAECHLRAHQDGYVSEAAIGLPGYKLGSSRICSIPLAVWEGAVLDGTPLTFVIGGWDMQSGNIQSLIQHWQGNCDQGKRFTRMAKCPQWIYHDLRTVFTDWNGIWEAARTHLAELEAEVDQLLGNSNVAERMRKINKAIATNLVLRESLTLQSGTLQIVQKKTSDAEFKARCEDMKNWLQHYSVLAKGNLEQLQNLLSIMVSLEQLSQGNAMARLNMLAFTFLPLSFIAAIFGMTQFTVAPKWYPAYALPMMVATIVSATILPKLIIWWESRSKFEIPTFKFTLPTLKSRILTAKSELPTWRPNAHDIPLVIPGPGLPRWEPMSLPKSGQITSATPPMHLSVATPPMHLYV